jgi:hypothetical protein
MKKVIKVDRVNSIEEATELESLGVQIICVEIDPIYTFHDGRKISLDMAHEIRHSLKRSSLCCEFLDMSKYSFDIIKSLNCKYIQCSRFSIIREDIRQKLASEEIGIIYSDFNISYDHDASWIMTRFEDENPETLNASFYDIDLINDFEKSWDFFVNECPKHSELLQVYEINELASSYPILVSIDYSTDNITEILNTISNIKGMSFRLGENPQRNDVRYISYSELIELLSFFHSSSINSN